MRVLVSAAYGNLGRRLVPKLVAAGAEVVACDFSPAAEQPLYEMGVKEVVIGDLRRTDIQEKAMQNIDTVYILFPVGMTNVLGFATSMIELAEARGVKHFVMSSCANAIPELIQHWEKYLAESALMGSSLNYTILKPAAYMEVTFPPEIFQTGKAIPFVNTGLSSFISIEDITDVTCKVIMEGEPHYFASYDLASAETQTTDSACAMIGEMFKKRGMDCEVGRAPLVDWAKFPASKHTQTVLGVICAYQGNHEFRVSPFVFNALMGHPARNLSEYFEDMMVKYQG